MSSMRVSPHERETNISARGMNGFFPENAAHKTSVFPAVTVMSAYRCKHNARARRNARRFSAQASSAPEPAFTALCALPANAPLIPSSYPPMILSAPALTFQRCVTVFERGEGTKAPSRVSLSKAVLPDAQSSVSIPVSSAASRDSVVPKPYIQTEFLPYSASASLKAQSCSMR